MDKLKERDVVGILNKYFPYLDRKDKRNTAAYEICQLFEPDAPETEESGKGQWQLREQELIEKINGIVYAFGIDKASKIFDFFKEAGWKSPEEIEAISAISFRDGVITGRKGYAQLADDQSLPETKEDAHNCSTGCPSCGEEIGTFSDFCMGYSASQRDMLTVKNGEARAMRKVILPQEEEGKDDRTRSKKTS